MARWTTVSFIQAFMRGQLGRKRVHGTYRVLDGDHCKVLVRASTQYGRPSGSSLIALNLGSEGAENISFFHQYNTNCFTYRMNRDLDTYNAPKLPNQVLDADDAHLLASGIIDFNEKETLVEIGDTPYLLYKKLRNDGGIVHWEGGIRFGELNILSSRVATISEAKELVKDPPGAEQLCDIWWAEKQPAGFQPPKLPASIGDVLSAPINPLDYGYTLEDCSILAGEAGTLGGQDQSIASVVPHKDMLKEPHDHRAQSYLNARNCWNDTCDAVINRLPLRYQGLTVKANKYGYGVIANERTGTIIKTSNGVFVKGKVRNEEDWEIQQKLDGWYKFKSLINRIKLK